MLVHSGEHQNFSQFSSLFWCESRKSCHHRNMWIFSCNALEYQFSQHLCLSPERLMGYYHHCGVNTLTREQVDVGFWNRYLLGGYGLALAATNICIFTLNLRETGFMLTVNRMFVTFHFCEWIKIQDRKSVLCVSLCVLCLQVWWWIRISHADSFPVLPERRHLVKTQRSVPPHPLPATHQLLHPPSGNHREGAHACRGHRHPLMPYWLLPAGVSASRMSGKKDVG